MSKVTSKLQVTIPKKVAEQYGIRPGDQVEFVAAGEVIRVVPPGKEPPRLDREARLALFDQATVRQRARRRGPRGPSPAEDRGWTREEIYLSGGTR